MVNIEAKKSLGQNFLKDEKILKIIASSFPTSDNDLIIEIGPGQGALTKYFIQMPGSLICYEIDERMKDILVHFKSERSSIIFDDFLNRDISKDIVDDFENIYVIANIPYYITTPIIEHLLFSGITINGMTLLVQSEVANRFIASPKSRDYGYFTVLLNHFFEMQKLVDVPPSAFSPSPKVFSTVVKFVRKKNIVSLDLDSFQVFLKKAFQYKRKTLRNNIGASSILDEFLESKNYSKSIRAEELSYDDFVELFNKLA